MNCEICGAPLDWEPCWVGCDEGWLDGGDERDVQCDVCHGLGGYPVCTALPHTNEQMVIWQRRKNNE